MKLEAQDSALLQRQLKQLAESVEQLLRIGLTAASHSTRETLDVTFREASRLKLLRLAATLRSTNDELGRHVNNHPDFSLKRLSFFLNRSWLLARGLSQALEKNDEAAWQRLLWTPGMEPCKSLDVVTLGVSKKVAQGAFCAFEFRLRSIDETLPNASSEETADATYSPCLVWSCVFPLKAESEIAPEAFLHLPHKQKFKSNVFLEQKIVRLTDIMLGTDAQGNRRITLTDASTVTAQEPFNDWSRFAKRPLRPFLNRLQNYVATPFDLEVELQEEIILDQWKFGAEMPHARDGQIIFPCTAFNLQMEAIVSSGPDGEALRNVLKSWSATDDKRKKKTVTAEPNAPLLGLLHFDRCRLLLQPLSLLTPQGPEYLTLTKDKVNTAALLKSLKF